MKRNVLALCLLLSAGAVYSQTKLKDGSVTGSSSLPNAQAILELESNNKGFLLPRVALTATTSPAPLGAHITGMMVYNNASAGDVLPGFYYNDGTKWVRLADLSGSSTGNDLTNGNGILVTGGSGATLKASSLRLDSTAVAKMVVQAPVKDSIVSAMGGQFWKTTGNTGTISASNFIGTADDRDLVFRTNNTERMRIDSATGNVGIGSVTPSKRLEVNANNDYLKITNLKVIPENNSGTNGIVIDTLTGELGRSVGKPTTYITKIISPIDANTPNTSATIGNLSVRVNNDGSGTQMAFSRKNIQIMVATADHVAIWAEVAGTGGTGFANYEFNNPLAAATWHDVNQNTTVNNKDFFRMLVSLYNSKEIYRVTVQLNNALTSPTVASAATIFIEQIK